MKGFYCIVLGFFLFRIAFSQVLINEVGSTNAKTIMDEDVDPDNGLGDFADWIELYNSGSTAVDLKNYSFIYSAADDYNTWKFPSYLLQPNDHLRIFASGKNRKTVIDHLEVPVYFNFPWKYFVGVSEPDSNWKEPTYNDAAWPTGLGGIGYGDGDDTTVIPPANSLFMRMAFNIPDTSKVTAAVCLLDFDDAFVLYLNGVEIGRYNIGYQGLPPLYSDTAYEEHEAMMYWTGNYSAGFWVDQALLDSAKLPGTNVFCVQTHSKTQGQADLTSIVNFLIGKSDTSVWFFPIPSDPANLHTNFTLSGQGFTLSLLNPSGAEVDKQVVGSMQTDHSRGRKTDGNPEWVIFGTPTPDTANSISPWFSDYASPVTSNLNAGFYSGSQSLSLFAPLGGVIRYTINGNTPSASSPLYSAPVSIDSSIVIRARMFSSNAQILPGPVLTNTYFINENITVPVVSVTTDPANLWDFNSGIYVMGPNADTNFPYYNANFWMGWEKGAHTEYFDKQGYQGFELDNVLQIHGNWSKGFPQRSFRIKANDDYGQTRIPFNLFPEKQLFELRAFNLRNAGIDWNNCHMRDGLMHRAVRKTFNDIMDHVSCVVFVNGQYFGVYEIRERQDEYYIEENHGLKKENLDVLRFYGDVLHGSNIDFLSMVDFIRYNDMTIPANYDTVKNYLFDIENITDYFLSEVYYSNPDWLGNNIKFWRSNYPPSPWRYILWDTDGGLGLFSSVNDNLLPAVTNSDTTNIQYYGNPHSFMMQSLFRNLEFRNYFINRYADLINTTFHPLNLGGLAKSMYNTLAPEMTRHFSLWGLPTPLFTTCMDSTEWSVEFSNMMDFINQRPPIARNYIQAEWSLPNQVDITLQTEPAGAGRIKMNTIWPDSLPWTGVYFNGVPVTMTAVPSPGYKFSHWQSPVQVTTPFLNTSMTLNVPVSESFTAYFIPLENQLAVFPNPSDNEFNIQFSVPENSQVDISVFDIYGRKLAEIYSDEMITTFGEHTFSFYPEHYSMSSGIYFVRMNSGGFSEVVKIIYSKNTAP